MTLFTIIRHGETDYNRNGRYQGQSDIALNAAGRQQSAALGLHLAHAPIDLIYASDLTRAQETARLMAGGRTVILDPRLREIDVGRAAGMTSTEIQQSEPTFWAALQQDPDRTPFPGGESTLTVQRRALEAFTAISQRYPQGQIAVVTHGMVVKMVVAHALGLSMRERHITVFGNCSITQVEWGRTEQKVLVMNETGHLSEAPCPTQHYL
jgi:broad specificity phosphatase PhoE